MRCAVRDTLATTFRGPDGQLSDQARVIVDGMASSRRPRSVIKWLENPRGGARVLHEIFSRGDVVTHKELDRLDEREVWSLRRTLVHLQVLPERVETLAQLEVRLHKLTATLPAPRRHLVTMYGTWWVLRWAYRRYERTGRFSGSSLRAAECRLIVAADLLSWADDQGITPDRLTQGDLERWIEVYPQWPYAGDFLRWARRRRLTTDLTLPSKPRHEPNMAMTEDQRWRLLSHCLHDITMPTELRAAGALLLLYGLPLTKIVELTREHLHPPTSAHTTDVTDAAIPGALRVTMSSPVVDVPPTLGRILARLPVQDPNPRTVPLIQPTPNEPSWLFPGRNPRGHINASVIGKQLKQHGIWPRASRNAALIALAADLPMSVVSTLFDVSIAAAVQWSRRAGRAWHDYIAATATERQRKAPLTANKPTPPRPATGARRTSR